MTVHIYALLDPVTREVRYIGKANDPAARKLSHIRDSGTRNTPVACWIRKLLAKNMAPELLVLACATTNDWQSLEILMIAQWRGSVRLLNLAEGGDQPFQTTEQRRNAALAANKARKQTMMNPKKKEMYERKRNLAVMLAGFRSGRSGIGAQKYAELSLIVHFYADVHPAFFGSMVKNVLPLEEIAQLVPYERALEILDKTVSRNAAMTVQ